MAKRNKKGESLEYVPLLSRMQCAIAHETRIGSPIPGIFNLLLFRCKILANGGRFENARTGFLADATDLGLAGLTPVMAEIILAGDKPPFWHWEGGTLVVDGYSPEIEKSLIAMQKGGKRGGEKSQKNRRKGRREKLHNALKKGKENKGNPPCNPPCNNIKEINTPYRSISKDTPTLGAGGAFDDDSPGGEPATQEDMQAMFDSVK